MEDVEQDKLFVGGISWETTEDILKDYFGKYGTVIGSVIAKDRNTGSPRGFAFVTFSESSAVDRALQDSHQILSRTVEVKRAIPRNEQSTQHPDQRGLCRNNGRTNSRSNNQSRTKKIFVGGLSADLTQEEFRCYFERFGRITDVVVMHDNTTQRPRGFGFITFDSENSVDNVMQNNFHELNGKLVEVKRAVPKDGISSNIYGYAGKLGGERDPNFNACQQGGYLPCNTRYGHFTSGYGNISGYPYGTGIFGSGFPSGSFVGIGYGFPPGSPWNPAMVGVQGSMFPYGSATHIHPIYPNGIYGAVGVAANGYGGVWDTAFSGKSVQMSIEDAQNAASSTSCQRGAINATDEISFDSGRSTGASTWQTDLKQK